MGALSLRVVYVSLSGNWQSYGKDHRCRHQQKGVVFLPRSRKEQIWNSAVLWAPRVHPRRDHEWCGIRLNKPEGKNNGTKNGITYFTCRPAYGVFVRAEKVRLDTSQRSQPRKTSLPRSSMRPHQRRKVLARTCRWYMYVWATWPMRCV